MNLRKNLGRVASTIVATALLASVATVPAFAASPANVTITKNITKDADAYAPATTFNFEVKPWSTQADEGALIQAGPVGGVYFDIVEGEKVYTGSINSAPSNEDVDGNNDTLVVAGTDLLTVDESVMLKQNPGIYRYEVKEVVPEDGNKYDGITYSTEVKYFDVYVTIDDTTKEKTVSAYMFTDEEAETGKDDGVFENKYDGENGAVKELKVKKELDGNQASPAEEFTFNITINSADGEQYKIVKTDVNGETEAITSGDATVTYLVSGQAATFTLQGGEYVTVYGLSPNDTYTVSENDYSDLGYTTTIKVDEEEQQSVSNKTISGADDTVTFINYRESTTPTGIVMNVAPYALLVVVAVAGCFVFLRKRNED